jgi:hypothetical protein
MRRTTAIAIGTLTLALLCTGLATGAGSAGKGMCRGKAVTITEDRKGDPIGPGKDVVLGTRTGRRQPRRRRRQVLRGRRQRHRLRRARRGPAARRRRR